VKVRWLPGGLTAVPGVRVGQVSHPSGQTGVTTALFDAPAVGAADVKGGAASTRQFGALDPLHVHGFVHALVFAGGSAFGLDAATGVVRWLEARGVGLPVMPDRVVPVVPTAILFDLGVGLPGAAARSYADLGEASCEAATSGPVAEGSVGAGTGAAVGKCMGIERAMKGGVGSAAALLPGGGRVGALAAVNAFGDVVAPADGRPVAGLRAGPRSRRLVSSEAAIVARGRIRRYGEAPPENTTLALVATDVPLTRVELRVVAHLASHGMVRTLSPCHTEVDGDLVVAAGTAGREIPPDLRLAGEGGAGACIDATAVGLVAAEAVSRSILRAVRRARGLGPLPGLADPRPMGRGRGRG
jgi:L-aminopeptidase/D-esterase-like protein